ncbi:hypothetical protein KSF78_0004430 [Schistosoma japonicum]|nr:hypothetical protein KSF78_0004430 [Schistosoma japonicum]
MVGCPVQTSYETCIDESLMHENAFGYWITKIVFTKIIPCGNETQCGALTNTKSIIDIQTCEITSNYHIVGFMVGTVFTVSFIVWFIL